MEQLSGLDAAFVQQDSARTPMHVTAVLFYDASNGRLDLPGLRQKIEGRLSVHPLFQRRLQRVTLDMDTPYWVPAGSTNWQYHLGTIGRRQLSWHEFQQMLGDFHAGQMNLSRPLWQMRLLDNISDAPGLPAQCQALLLKAHHCAIDGISLAQLLVQLHDGADEAELPASGSKRAPSQLQMWSRFNLNTLQRQVKFAETFGKMIPALSRYRETRRENADLPPTLPYRCRFNDRVSSRRSVGIVLVPIEHLLLIKRALRRVTYNDIASSIIAGALRRYLREKGQLPDKSLVAGMPINLRARETNARGSNRIATMRVGLATAITDPVERLHTLHQFAVAGKRAIDTLGTGTVMDISDSLAPPLLAEGVRAMAIGGSLGSLPVPFHTMISNVPGPGTDETLDGLPLLACSGLGPVRDNMGLFHIVSCSASYCSISFNACGRLLPDASHYRNCLHEAYRELYQAISSV